MTKSVNQTTQMLRNHTNLSYGSLKKQTIPTKMNNVINLLRVMKFVKDWYDPLPSNNTGMWVCFYYKYDTFFTNTKSVERLVDFSSYQMREFY